MQRLEEGVNKPEGDGLRARWESGRCMLRMREGKQFRRGVLATLAQDLGVHRSELTARMKFAETFPTEDELANAISKFKNLVRHQAARVDH